MAQGLTTHSIPSVVHSIHMHVCAIVEVNNLVQFNAAHSNIVCSYIHVESLSMQNTLLTVSLPKPTVVPMIANPRAWLESSQICRSRICTSV